MRKVNTLPPVEIYDILHEAEAADITLPKNVEKWWEEETAINQGAQPPQADNKAQCAMRDMRGLWCFDSIC